VPEGLVPGKILAINYDSDCLSLIEDCFKGSECVGSLTNGILQDKDTIDSFDLILLDGVSDEDSGYSQCKDVRRLNQNIPIIFVSNEDNSDSRLKAYGVGASDYISEPFSREELKCKADLLIGAYHREQFLREKVRQNSQMAMDAQKDSFSLSVVNRFTLSSAQCKDVDTLLVVFFHTLKELGTEGAIKILEMEPRASKDGVSRLEAEVLQLSDKLPRIKAFGKGRALYNWTNCQLLVRNVGELIDMLAFLMDAMELSISRISSEQRLMEQVTSIEEFSRQSEQGVAELFDSMIAAISDELLKLGLISSLDIEEEDRINAVMATFTEKINERFTEQEEFSIELKDTIDFMREPNKVFKEYIDSINNRDDFDDLAELF